jgi:hypothetical protein
VLAEAVSASLSAAIRQAARTMTIVRSQRAPISAMAMVTESGKGTTLSRADVVDV